MGEGSEGRSQRIEAREVAKGPGPPCVPWVLALCDSPAATQPNTGQESFAPPPEDSEHMAAAALRDNDDPSLVWLL